jgi:hypothetical protein
MGRRLMIAAAPRRSFVLADSLLSLVASASLWADEACSGCWLRGHATIFVHFSWRRVCRPAASSGDDRNGLQPQRN